MVVKIFLDGGGGGARKGVEAIYILPLGGKVMAYAMVAKVYFGPYEQACSFLSTKFKTQ